VSLVFLTEHNRISFFFMTEKYVVVYRYHISLSIHWIFGHLDWFHSLVIVNRAIINMGMHVYILYIALHYFGYMPNSGMAGSKGSPIFNLFWGTFTLFPYGCTSLHSYRQYRRVPFKLYPHQHFCCLFSWWLPNLLDWDRTLM
jgi:hypothetical protein